jgi:hypothetical protein
MLGKTLLVVMALLATSNAAYDEGLAKSMLLISSAAYSNDPAACYNLDSTMQVTATFNNTFLGFGTFGFTAVDSGSESIIIAFRGSDKISELIEEALTSVTPVAFLPNKALNVNAFFYGSEGLLYDGLAAEVAALRLLYPNYTVLSTGHSLGGAVATITLMHLSYDGIITPETDVMQYTFGEPRVGDYAFAQDFNKRFPNAYRLDHYRDIVCHLPPCHTTINSKLELVCDNVVDPSKPYLWAFHHGTEVWYQEAMPDVFDGSSGLFKVCIGDPFGEDAKCSDSLILKDSISDHTHYFTAGGSPFEVADSCSNSTLSIKIDRRRR